MYKKDMRKEISVTARVWKDVPLEKGVFIHSLTDLLNDHIDLSTYGKGVEEFNFTAIIEPDNFFPDKFRYSGKCKRVDIEWRMPYRKVLSTPTDVFKGQLARAYLGAIDEIIKSNISGFDALRFRKDVEDLFEKQGWLAYA